MIYSTWATKVRSKALGSNVKEHVSFFGHTIVETTDGAILVDQVATEYTSIDEAKQLIHQNNIHEGVREDIQRELYEDMADRVVAEVIREHHPRVRISDTLIESYVELAASKIFTADPVVCGIRDLNPLDKLVEGRYDFELDDGTTIVVTEETQRKINKTFGQHADVIDYMRLSAENFLSVVNQLED